MNDVPGDVVPQFLASSDIQGVYAMVVRADIDDSLSHCWRGLNASAGGVAPEPITGECINDTVLLTNIHVLVANGRRGDNCATGRVAPELFTRDGGKGVEGAILRAHIDDFI